MKKIYLAGIVPLSFTLMTMLSSIAYADPQGCPSKGQDGCTNAAQFCPINKSLGKIKYIENDLGIPTGVAKIYECQWKDNECKDYKEDHHMKCDVLDPICMAEMYGLETAC